MAGHFPGIERVHVHVNINEIGRIREALHLAMESR
jgi:hypothetical protein